MATPEDFIITRKRKKYKFALFAEADNCFEAAEFNTDVQKRFVAKAPLVLELGAGTAEFLVELASRHPKTRYIAVDVKADRLITGAKKANGLGLKNIVFVRAHAEQLPELVPAQGVNELWLTFSDPYPKKRHAKHRLSHPKFLSLYKSLLATDGLLKLKTDNQALFQWSLEQLTREKWIVSELSFDLHNDETLSEDYKILTSYEKRFLDQDLPIYYLSASSS